MGLGPIMAIYQARFNRYLDRPRHQGHHAANTSGPSWATANATSPNRSARSRSPSREKLDNLIFVINCNLQRLDGPVRGNGKIIQELEGDLPRRRLERDQGHLGRRLGLRCSSNDETGLLVKRMGEVVDGEYQKYVVMPRRLHPRALLRQVSRAARAGRAPAPTRSCRSCAAAATTRRRSTPPTRPPSNARASRPSSWPRRSRATAWAKRGEGRNITHHQKKLERGGAAASSARASAFRSPTTTSPRRRSTSPPTTAPEMQYLRERRQALGGFVPQRRHEACPSRSAPPRRRDDGEVRRKGSDGREVSTTMAFVRLLTEAAAATRRSASTIVPIVPDESRTFGMEGLFRQFGIYSHAGQLYEPVDSDTLALLQRSQGRPDSRRRASPRPARCRRSSPPAPAYATHGINMIPFFIYYSMFGFQRIGDLIWAAADMRAQGLPARRHRRPHDAERRRPAAPGRPQPLLNATRSRPCRAYDPAFAYEIAVIVAGRHAADVRRTARDDLLLHHRRERELRACRRCPPGVEEGILRGHVQARRSTTAKPRQGHACNCSAAARSCARRCRPRRSWPRSTASRADVWSVTSYNELRRDAPRRRALEHAAPDRAAASSPTSSRSLADDDGLVHRRQRLRAALPEQIAPLGAAAACSRWAPTASAAARPRAALRRSSRSTPSASRWRRCYAPVQEQAGATPRPWSRRRSRTWTSIRRRSIRARLVNGTRVPRGRRGSARERVHVSRTSWRSISRPPATC